MLELLDGFEGGAAARRRVLVGVERHTEAVEASRGAGDLAQVARAEAEVRADPRGCICVDARGDATVRALGRGFRGGRFETPRLCGLKAWAHEARALAGRPAARPRLWLIDGVSPASDIGALQATAAPRSLFQVASQFNCLESPGAFLTDVADYVHDPTQGPRASISAWPGTLVRHYAAPAVDGTRFVQSAERQVNLLADVCDPDVATVRSGYLRSEDIRHPAELAGRLCERFENVRIGMHDGIEVALGYNWDGGVAATPHRTIAQVLTSTVAAGMYGDLDEGDKVALAICERLQRAAYLGTLLAAAALGQDRAVLTLIGGGVFANPLRVIWNAILWATDEVACFLHRDLTIIVNGRTLGDQLPLDDLLAAARARGGGLLRLSRRGAPQLET